MGPVVVLDLDRTLARFPATSRIFKRMFLSPPQPGPVLWALVMLGLMHGLWFWSAAVRLQRRIVMSLFARAPQDRFEAEVDRMVGEVVADWRVGLGAELAPLLAEAEAVYIVSHCPEPLAAGVAEALGFDGHWAVPVRDYLGGAPGGVFDKAAVLGELRQRWPGRTLHFYADDLVDLPGLVAADDGNLVNASWFSRAACRMLAPGVRVWA